MTTTVIPRSVATWGSTAVKMQRTADCHGSKEPRNDGKGKRHPEEQSDVGIYLCEDTKRHRKIATGWHPRNDDDRHPEERKPSRHPEEPNPSPSSRGA